MCFDWRWWGSIPCVIHPAQYTQIMKWIFLLISFPGDLWEQYQRWFPFCTFCRYLRAIGCFCDQKRGKKLAPLHLCATEPVSFYSLVLLLRFQMMKRMNLMKQEEQYHNKIQCEFYMNIASLIYDEKSLFYFCISLLDQSLHFGKWLSNSNAQMKVILAIM